MMLCTIKTPRPEGNKATPAWENTKSTLLRGLETLQCNNIQKQLYAAIITITSPTTMSLPETYMRAALAEGIYHTKCEEMCRDLHCDPVLFTYCVEAHPGPKRRNKEAEEGPTGDQEEGAEEGALQGGESVTKPTQCSVEEACRGIASVHRNNLSGSAHVHMGIVLLAPRGQLPQRQHIIPYVSALHSPAYIHIKHTETTHRERGARAKDFKRLVYSTDDVEAIIRYILKNCRNKRAHKAMRILGSSEAQYLARVCGYNTELLQWLQEFSQTRIPVYIESPHSTEETPPSAPGPPSGTTQMGTTPKEQQQIIALKYLYQTCAKNPGKRGSKHQAATAALSRQRWSENFPPAFAISHSKAREVDTDLNASMDSEPTPPSAAYVEFDALTELYLWLSKRMLGASAKKFIMHLSMYTLARRRKAKQIYVKGVPDAGKTTLSTLIDKTFFPRVFSVGGENSSSFTASAFLDKVPDAIWMQDEFHSDLYHAFPAAEFNKITEGFAKIQVCVKNRAQRTLKWTGHTIILSNYDIRTITKGESPRYEETLSRFAEYSIKVPENLVAMPTATICTPQHLYRDLSTVAHSITEIDTRCLDPSNLPWQTLPV